MKRVNMNLSASIVVVALKNIETGVSHNHCFCQPIVGCSVNAALPLCVMNTGIQNIHGYFAHWLGVLEDLLSLNIMLFISERVLHANLHPNHLIVRPKNQTMRRS